jgi:hypothetical protein
VLTQAIKNDIFPPDGNKAIMPCSRSADFRTASMRVEVNRPENHMTRKALPQYVQSLFQSAKDRAQDLAENHKLEVGAVEMAVGAALLAWGVHQGVAEMGVHLVATNLDLAGGVGGGLVGTALGVVGSIGIVGMGGAIGVPAALLTGGAVVLLGSLGYTVGDITGKLIDPSWLQRLEGPAVALLGVLLLVDGARRIAGDARVSQIGARVTASALHLRDCSAEVVARTLAQLRAIAMEVVSPPRNTVDAMGSVASAATAGAGGFALVSSISTAAVTVAGSNALGGLALSMGLLSAPVWPAVAAGAVIGGGVYTVWKVVTRVRKGGRGADEPALLGA